MKSDLKSAVKLMVATILPFFHCIEHDPFALLSMIISEDQKALTTNSQHSCPAFSKK